MDVMSFVLFVLFLNSFRAEDNVAYQDSGESHVKFNLNPVPNNHQEKTEERLADNQEESKSVEQVHFDLVPFEDGTEGQLKNSNGIDTPDWENAWNDNKLKPVVLTLGEIRYNECLQKSIRKTDLTCAGHCTLSVNKQTFIDNVYMQKCLLFEKAQREVENTFTRRQNFITNFNDMFVVDREIDIKDRQFEDCLYNTRGIVRQVPTDCYWQDKLDDIVQFHNLWNQIGPQLMYTFDFVLHSDTFPGLKENQLWYLIAYLKLLAINVKNPMTIVNKVLNEVDEEIYSKLEEHYTELDNDLLALEIYTYTTAATYFVTAIGNSKVPGAIKDVIPKHIMAKFG